MNDKESEFLVNVAHKTNPTLDFLDIFGYDDIKLDGSYTRKELRSICSLLDFYEFFKRKWNSYVI